MKNSWILLIVILLCCKVGFTQDYLNHVSATIPACLNGDYVLTFEDNFDGTELDMDVWMLKDYEQGSTFHINTLESDNLEVSNGTLKIMINNQPKQRLKNYHQLPSAIMSDGLPNLRWYDYSSSEIWTRNSDFRYGKYEIRAKMDACEAIWPAFWTYSGDGNTPGGSRWNELDIFEIYHEKPNGVNKWQFTSTLHYDYYNDGDKEKKEFINEIHNNFDQWHIFTCYFTETKISIYIDNVLVDEILKYKNTDCASQDESYGNLKELYAWPREMGHLILNMAISGLGGQGNGDISDNPSSAFPCTFEVDYVRYWQKSDCEELLYIPTLSPVVFGTNTAWDIRILDQARTPNGLGAVVVANNSIETLGDFEIELGATFDAWIDPNLCSLYKSGVLDDQNEGEDKPPQASIQESSEVSYNYENLVYPNPFSSEVFVEVSEDFEGAEYYVYDMMGNLVLSGVLTSSVYEIKGFRSFSSGLYQILIKKGATIEAHKVLKE